MCVLCVWCVCCVLCVCCVCGDDTDTDTDLHGAVREHEVVRVARDRLRGSIIGIAVYKKFACGRGAIGIRRGSHRMLIASK